MERTRAVTKAVNPARQTWVQTEREAHVQWGRLAMSKPRAAAVMHQLVALMDRENAVVISLATLEKLTGVSQRTIQRALKDLEDAHWVQIVQLGARGTVNAYIINERVAWADYRDNKRFAKFSATIIANADEQSATTLDQARLRKVPIIHPPEQALAAGEWPAGEQGYLDGLEPVVEGPLREPAELDMKEVTNV